MNLVRFLVLTLIGSLIWNTALVTAGYVLRDNWEDVEPIISIVQYVVIALIVAGIAWFAWTKLRTGPLPTGTASSPLGGSIPLPDLGGLRSDPCLGAGRPDYRGSATPRPPITGYAASRRRRRRPRRPCP